MIHAPLSLAPRHLNLHPLFPEAFAFLEQFDRGTPDGRVTLDGDRLFAIVQRYQPAEEKIWEAHRSYGDIQALFSGAESCGVAPTPLLRPLSPYDPGKDVEKFLAPSLPASRLILRTGEFAVFYPEDAHQPGVRIPGEDAPVLKVVVKFRLL